MTLGAVGAEERGLLPRHDLEHPSHLVRVDVKQAGLRVERGPAVLAAAVYPGKDDDPLLVGWGEGIGRRVLLKELECRRVRRWRAVGQVRFGELLPHEWSGECGKALRVGGHFTREHPFRHPAPLAREELF